MPTSAWASHKGANGLDQVKVRSHLSLFLDVSPYAILTGICYLHACAFGFPMGKGLVDMQ